ncbi:LemA family protein [Bacteroidales bacterium OttesenSCG-928-K03]|nr:LemA family protein [Bacteroidales bacterium OttesenSCG-928-K03]
MVLTVVLAIAAIALVIVIWAIGARNSLVRIEENVEKQWSQVENVYQRRADLIPNLVNTVKGYANHEQETLTQVVEARSKASSVNIDPSNMNESSLANFEAAQGELSSAISRLMVVIERYPDLKANQNFMMLQSELEGTENRISVERKKFNEVTQEYNTAIRYFPKNIIARRMGLEKKPYFTAQAGANVAPVVEF